MALLITGHFAAYTCIRPALERVAGLGAGAVGSLLPVYGVAGVAGTFLGGAAATRDPRRALPVVSAVPAGSVPPSVPAGGSLPAAAALLVVRGPAYGGVAVGARKAEPVRRLRTSNGPSGD
ncbi:MFS transporter [Streptomyces lushanensis]|uniref:MFS transporter n=1 Tax=Streptomyces lushanensis TaxID=1434255 RepID=UPI00114CA07B|nr:MFS transporter [Streptomyces lushanensis]